MFIWENYRIKRLGVNCSILADKKNMYILSYCAIVYFFDILKAWYIYLLRLSVTNNDSLDIKFMDFCFLSQWQ